MKMATVKKRHNDDDRFDRLVDGELTERERRELLESLDVRPDGWRRCALAFLEAQCWKMELGFARRTKAAVSAPDAAPVRPAPRRSRTLRTVGTLSAMAAAFLLALGAGLWWRHTHGVLPSGGNEIAAINRPLADPVLIELQNQGPNAGQQTVPGPVHLPVSMTTPWRLVLMHPPGSTKAADSVQLPARIYDNDDDRWLEETPVGLPADLAENLRRNGYQVETRRQVAPTRLPDGRRLMIPVDNVDIRYVGNNTYQ
jgi:hypothetical protein